LKFSFVHPDEAPQIHSGFLEVAMVSLGEIELGKRNRPVAAIESFSADLRVVGALEREARFGRIRALRALGRDGEADAEGTTSLRDYPTSIQAATLRRQAHGRQSAKPRRCLRGHHAICMTRFFSWPCRVFG
jgi:hypothetical protein